MVISYSSVLEVMTVLSEEKELRVTVTESGKGALLTGGVAGLGGLLLGPLGLALGGAVGGCLAAWRAQGNFKPVMEVILYDLKQEQRERMVESVRTVLANLGRLIVVLLAWLVRLKLIFLDASDAIALVAMVQGNQALKQRILTEMVTFLSRQCNIYVNE